MLHGEYTSPKRKDFFDFIRKGKTMQEFDRAVYFPERDLMLFVK